MGKNYFIAASIEHPGRVHRYLVRCFGMKAFTWKGTIKSSYLNRAIAFAKREGETSLERALLEAKTLKKLGKKRKVMV